MASVRARGKVASFANYTAADVSDVTIAHVKSVQLNNDHYLYRY